MNAEDNARTELGKKIREFRKIRGLTQEDLGEKADMNYKYIGELERGKVNVSIDSLVRISMALDIAISDLFRQDSDTVMKALTQKDNPLGRLTPEDRSTINKSLKLLGKFFSYKHT